MTTCPACGVAVVPGYVRCPKCHKPLPQGSRAPSVAGGTSLEEPAGFPMLPVAIGVVIAGGIALYFGLRAKPAPPPPPAASPSITATAAAGPTAAPQTATTEPATATVDPASVATELDRVLDRQRLWSTVEVIGSRIEVRSGSCSDPNMATQLDAVISALRAVGLTSLRCVEPSGRVVMDRDL